MKCFYHPQVDAVGICKNCHRGLCTECVTEVEFGLACKNRCEQRVIATDQLVTRSIVALQKAPRSYMASVIFFFVMGLFFFAIALTSLSSIASQPIVYLYFVMGIVCAGLAVYWYRLGSHLNRNK